MSEHQKGSRRPPSPIDGYRTTVQASSGGPGDASVDELLTSSEGAFVVREAIEDLGAAELRTRLRVVQRLVRDEGITQGGTAPGRPALQRWSWATRASCLSPTRCACPASASC